MICSSLTTLIDFDKKKHKRKEKKGWVERKRDMERNAGMLSRMCVSCDYIKYDVVIDNDDQFPHLFWCFVVAAVVCVWLLRAGY